MSLILRKGVIRGGQVFVGEPINLPDGTEVTITGRAGEPFLGAEDNDRPSTPEEIAAGAAAMKALKAPDIEFMAEDEQTDDPVAIRQWIDDLRAIPPVPETPEQEAKRLAWEEQMRLFNIEAVRKQLDEAAP